MVLLGKSYQTLLDRGLPARPAASFSSAASNGASATPFEQSPKKHLVPKSDPSIFIHSTKTVYDSLSSSPTQSIGPTPPPQPDPRAPVAPPAPSNVPAIFTQRSQSTTSPVASSPARTSLPPSSSTLGAIQRQLLAVWSKVWSGVPPETRSTLESHLRPIREVLVRERVRGSSRQPLPHRDLDMLVIQSQSHPLSLVGPRLSTPQLTQIISFLLSARTSIVRPQLCFASRGPVRPSPARHPQDAGGAHGVPRLAREPVRAAAGGVVDP